MPSSVVVSPARALAGEAPALPGDKSISHRALLFGALAQGTTRVRNCAPGADVAATARALTQLGTPVLAEGTTAIVRGGPWRPPAAAIDCANSGSTMRFLAGALAGRRIGAILDGDASLRRRPMRRVSEPLGALGARIATSKDGTAPLRVMPGARLQGASIEVDVPSAQVVTALVFAALGAAGTTRLRGRLDGRDHTQRIAPRFGARLVRDASDLVIDGGPLRSTDITVPGDPSAAAFWLAAAAIVPGARMIVRDVSLNPTRLGFVRALERMGARIEWAVTSDDGEPAGTIAVTSAPLRGITIAPSEVPSLVDELPLLAAVAAYAQGTTEVTGAAELRVKESDRIASTVAGLRALGVAAEERPDGFAIVGGGAPHGGRVDAAHDHRLAMTFAVLALGATAPVTIDGADVVAVSHPEFFADLRRITA